MSVFIRLTDYKSSEEKRQAFNDPENRYEVNSDDFKKIPGSPIAYWVRPQLFTLFGSKKITDLSDTRLGMATANNDIFLRFWAEVSTNNSLIHCANRLEAKQSMKKWFPYQKGGEFRKWYGNLDYFVNWENDGYEIRNYADVESGKIRSHNYNLDFIFSTGISWSALTSNMTSARLSNYSLFDNAGSSLFVYKQDSLNKILSYMNSKIILAIIPLISPTLNYQPGDIAKLPAHFEFEENKLLEKNSIDLINISKSDWDSFETSWDFEILPVISGKHKGDTLEASYDNWREFGKAQTAEMKELEEENNKIFIDAYGLQDELTPDVPIEQITLTVNPAYRYGKGKTDEEYEELFRTDSMKELISYSIGCMMGRYSLDEKGLIYAHSSNEGFDHSKYTTFPADEDGIIPLTDLEWFPDDATNRFIEFIDKVWGKDTKEQNLKFVADSLSPKRGETPEETIRRYMSANFFKDHMKRYKKRPIYWLFSSGKEKAFEALVYLHRYNESTLSRMRSEYVNPLQTNMNAYMTRLDKSLEDSSLSSSEQKKLEKERETLIKKITELRTFDEQLKHYADQRISIDLDDGVKVNYGKFGDLLAEVNNITGGKDDD